MQCLAVNDFKFNKRNLADSMISAAATAKCDSQRTPTSFLNKLAFETRFFICLWKSEDQNKYHGNISVPFNGSNFLAPDC